MPLLADLRPSGKFVMEDLHKVLLVSHCLHRKTKAHIGAKDVMSVNPSKGSSLSNRRSLDFLP